MRILGGTDQVLLNIGSNQQRLTSLSSHLASGLRIQSAADDPSGNSIAQGLQSKINGLQQSVENVQTGTNLLTVADGAAATIQAILQRINSLIIESNSDINSNQQLVAIQAEIQQQLLEINRISQNANFNGVTLFDGSHDTHVAAPGANVTVVVLNPGLLPDGTIPTSSSVSNPQAPPGYNGAPLQNVLENPNAPLIDGLLVAEVTSYSANPVDPVSGPLGVPGITLQQVIYSPSTGFNNGNGNESIITNALPTGAGFDAGGGPGNIPFPSNINQLTVDFPNFSPSDVGVAIAYGILLPQASGNGTALNINDGGNEGSTIAISLPSLSTSALQVSDISVLRPTQVDDQLAQGQTTGVDSSNQYAAMYAQFAVQQALESISAVRAQLGAQMVAAGDDANNATVTGLNLTSSMSSITDLNIGTAVTQFTQTQILSSVGTSVLSAMQVDARGLTNLIIGALR